MLFIGQITLSGRFSSLSKALEGTLRNLCERFRDAQAGHGAAAVKGKATNLDHRVRDRQSLQRNTAFLQSAFRTWTRLLGGALCREKYGCYCGKINKLLGYR